MQLRCALCLLLGGALFARAGSYDQPWVVSLQRKESGEYVHKCAGALIEANWVLTTATCFVLFVDKESWRAGIHRSDLSKSASEEHECSEDIKVSEWIVHELYDEKTNVTGDNNLALVHLESAASCAESSPQMVATLDGAGSSSTLVIDSSESYSSQPTLVGGFQAPLATEDKMVESGDLDLQSADYCEGASKSYDKSTHLCAAANTLDLPSDAGSPIVLPPADGETPPVLVALGLGCWSEAGSDDEPLVVCIGTRVSSYDTWIFANAPEVEIKYNYTERVIIIVVIVSLICGANMLAICLYLRSRRRKANKVTIGVPVAVPVANGAPAS